MKRHIHEYKSNLEKRFLKIEGHVRAVNKMIQEDKDCEDILIQISAIIAALKSSSVEILQEHIRYCLTTNGTESIESTDAGIVKFNNALRNVMKSM